jgi:amidophosphoribosyltransferase
LNDGIVHAEDKAHEECGVIAINNGVAINNGITIDDANGTVRRAEGSAHRDDGSVRRDDEAAREAFYALFALQHRGQESAGIASSDGRRMSMHKALGLVSGAFSEADIVALTGHLAIGHTRYSTTGEPSVRNAQPFQIETMHGPLALAHNGNLVNAPELRRRLLERGAGLSSSSDTEVMVMMLAAAQGATWPERIAACMREWHGAFSFVLLTRDAVYAARDPWGFRPLCSARLPDGGSAAASETCALATLGCSGAVDVEPGRIIELGPDGPVDRGGVEPASRRASCVFEYVYFSRPDSVWNGASVHEARRRFGAALAGESPVDADVVIAVPDSSISAAIGYAQASGLPYDEGFAKNRYIGRTFIQPTQALRDLGVALKFNAMPGTVRGRRVVVVDDSIVRGTTTGPLVRLLRKSGATEVHVRIACPPIRHPCHMGVDMGTYDSLIAHRMSVDGIRGAVGADSLAYLSLDGMMRALSDAGARSATGDGCQFCSACFSGDYPLDVGGAAGKNGFEVI